jgi:putative PEP-CTERM system histidine kinase
MGISTLQAAAAVMAALTSVVLAGAIFRHRPLRLYHWLFSAGMLSFAAEALASQRLLQRGDAGADVELWVGVLTVASLASSLIWLAFVAAFRDTDTLVGSRRAWLGLAGGGVVAIGAMIVLNELTIIRILRVEGFFELMTFDAGSRATVIVQLLITVIILVGLELNLRTSAGAHRWHLKYLVVGLGSIFLVRFYVLTSLLLFNVLAAALIATASATMFLGNLAIALAMYRGVRAGGLALSRQLVFRSTMVGLLGAYLVAIGALGWLLTRLEIPQMTFWAALLVFVSGTLLIVLMLSVNVKWRVKRFITRHVYRNKYDYRQQWRGFTARLSSAVTPAECVPPLLQGVMEAVGAAEGALYLICPADGHYRCAAAVGPRTPSATLDAESVALRRLKAERGPLALVDLTLDWGGSEALQRFASEFALAVPLTWQEQLTGVLLLGPERAGAEYGAEDLEFLATVGEQAAGVLAMAQLSERVAQAREFEAFHRLTSFVIHDIKNSVASLSLLSRNALQNFDDPEFQRDAIRTISSAVTRMKGLLGKLSAPSRAEALEMAAVDLKAVAAEVVGLARQGGLVRLVKETESVVIRGDAEALRRVLENLVSNAIQAVTGVGRVAVKTYADGAWAVMEVTDTGVGMSDEYVRESLFVPFRSTKPNGWGVGLYQAREIVQRHGGSISVSSRRGEGTTFWVRLPLAPVGAGEVGEVVNNHAVQTGGR